MGSNFLQIGLALLEGIGFILSPCILPILPIILAGSIDGSKKRPFGITLGFVLTFSIFTLFSRHVVQHFGFDISIIRHISFFLLAVLGIIMLSSYLTELFAKLTNKLSGIGSQSTYLNKPKDSFFSGIIFGGLVGLIWTPCAGPILAAVIVQSVLQQTSLNSFLIVAAFGLGAGIPMLCISLFGRALITRLSFLKTHTNIIRKILGLIILASVAFMIFSDNFYSANFSTMKKDNVVFQTALLKGLMKPYPAPEIVEISDWFNSPPLDLKKLKGKVILIDFWTYSCINCRRTLPYLKEWHNKYHDKGLIIIGVHTPEFEFEKDPTNVENAVKNLGIPYPVALDSRFGTWQSFKNQYWPAHYLIDTNGNVVYEHFGEGDYDVTENNIRYLLKISGTNTTVTASETGIAANETPETYLGFARQENYAGEPIEKNTSADYTYSENLAMHQWSLQGAWNIGSQFIQSTAANASIKIHFNAKKVFAVMGSSNNQEIHVTFTLNGHPMPTKAITVDHHTLYTLLDLQQFQGGVLELTADAPGLQVFTFTFGS